MKKFLRYFMVVLAVVLVIVIGLLSYVSLALPNVDKAPDLKVEITPEKVERGKYLAWNVVLCADCHSVRDYSIFAAPPKPGTEFAGGEIFDQSMGFPGVFVSANITPAGIGDWTDGELFRLITTGVKRDGEPIFPVMPYHNYGKLDPEDIYAVIAYIRTLEPVESNHPKSKADFPFNFILRTIPEKAKFTKLPDMTDKQAYGKYIYTAAACGECHTKFEKGEFVGPECGGGREFEFPDGSVLRTPNLTPHKTGIGHISKSEFIAKFKAYADSAYVLPKVNPGEFQTIMPWAMYAGMKEEDLAAIYDYLQTLEPCDNNVERFTAAK